MTDAFTAIDWERWAPREEATVLFVIRSGRILLIDKKRGLGAGKVNGAGGRLLDGETPIDAAIRECREELGITPLDVAKQGELLFQMTDGTAIRIHVFVARDCDGAPRETDEARPFWVAVDRIPYDRMWTDDRHWMPLLLAGRTFEARSLFSGEQMLGYELVAKPDGF